MKYLSSTRHPGYKFHDFSLPVMALVSISGMNNKKLAGGNETVNDSALFLSDSRSVILCMLIELRMPSVAAAVIKNSRIIDQRFSSI